jgi:hypothetical protein
MSFGFFDGFSLSELKRGYAGVILRTLTLPLQVFDNHTIVTSLEQSSSNRRV